MSEGLSSLEEFAIRLSIIPISLVAIGCLGYSFCAGEAIIKAAYRKIRRDPMPFKELYRENFLREEK